MEYCPKCGNKVDDTMTFCPKCGASLKMETPTPTTSYDYRYRYRDRNEKNEKPEKRDEKHEKPGGSYVGLLIAGLVIVALGVLSYINVTTHILSGPNAGAIGVVIIGVLILCAGIYYSSRVRRRNPSPT